MLQEILYLFPPGTIFTLDDEQYHSLMRELRANHFCPQEPWQDADEILIQRFDGVGGCVDVAHDLDEIKVTCLRKEG